MSELLVPGRNALRSLRELLRSRVVLGVAFGISSALTGLAILLAASPPASGPLGPTSQLILTLLGLNFVLILALVAAVVLRLLELLESQSRDAGARLHVRFVRLFALAAVAPAAVVFLFYGVLVSQGVEKWFSDRVRTVVENSATVFRSYVEEQTRYIGDHMGPMATDLNREAAALDANPSRRVGYLEALAAFHGFPSAYLLDAQGRVLAKTETPGAPGYVAPVHRRSKPPTAVRFMCRIQRRPTSCGRYFGCVATMTNTSMSRGRSRKASWRTCAMPRAH